MKWHQDIQAWPHTDYSPLTMGIYLQDTSKEMGPLLCVPGSHENELFGLQWMLAGRGPLTVGAGQVGGAACTHYAAGGRPDVQFNVMPLSVDKPGDPLHS